MASGYTDNSEDCDDSDALLNPETLWYPDADNDEYGDEYGSPINSCEPIDFYVNNDLDCDDSSVLINPGVDEICDGYDSNCDGIQELDDLDRDGDGVAICEGDCDDLDSTVNNSTIEICNNRIDDDCSGRIDDGCSIDTSSADIQISGEYSYDSFGYRLDAGGDLNADGYNDLSVGAYQTDASYNSGGRAYLFLGPLTGNSTINAADADVVISPDDGGDHFGSNLAHGGDANGDGYDDLIIEAYNDEAGGVGTGSVFLFLGPITSTELSSSDADSYMTGEAENDDFGYFISKFVDLDGDGSDEIASSISNIDDYRGGLAFFSDPVDQQGYLDADVFIEGSSDGALAGLSAAFTDFSGDGIMDIAYGEPGLSQGFIINGPVSGMISSENSDVLLYVSSGVELAISNLSTGDFNGDGYQDLVVGSMRSDFGGNESGLVATFNGPVKAAVDVEVGYDFATYSSIGGVDMGSYLDGLQSSDMDADSHDDLFIGVPKCGYSGDSAGAIFGYYGPLSGVRSSLYFDRAVYGDSVSDQLGYDIALGDVDGDGLSDLIGGASNGGTNQEGALYVFWNSWF